MKTKNPLPARSRESLVEAPAEHLPAQALAQATEVAGPVQTGKKPRVAKRDGRGADEQHADALSSAAAPMDEFQQEPPSPMGASSAIALLPDQPVAADMPVLLAQVQTIPAVATDAGAAAGAAPAASADAAGAGSSPSAVAISPLLLTGLGVLGVAVAAKGGSGGQPSASVPFALPDMQSPSFASATSATVAENSPATTVVYRARATDNVAVTAYTLAGGADDGKFTLDASTGELRFKASPDFETPASTAGTNSYVVKIKASDAAGNSTVQEVTVNVSDVDDTAPTFVGTTLSSVPENTASSAVIYVAHATDNVGVTGYALAGGPDDARFTLDARTGELRFKVAPDYEAPGSAAGSNEYTVKIQAVDAAGNATVRTVTVDVTPVNEGAPTFRAFSGQEITDFGGDDAHRALLALPDGKILAAGYNSTSSTGDASTYDFDLVRYNADGSLDTSFGVGGKQVIDFAHGFDAGWAMLATSGGKIVVAGLASDAQGVPVFGLSRSNADGSPDLSFGTDGKVLTAFTGGAIAAAVAQTGSGQLLVAGLGGNGSAFALARYNADGSLDTGFGTGGTVNTVFNGRSGGALTVLPMPNGDVVLTGYADRADDGGTNFALARYHADGSLDTSFGAQGLVQTSFFAGFSVSSAYQSFVTADGHIVLAGFANDGSSLAFAIARYNADGSLDTSFGGHGTGMATTNLFSPEDSQAYAALQLADGRFILAGSSADLDLDKSEFAMVRYNADGTVDTSFGDQGKVVSAFSVRHAEAVTILQSADGHLILAGYAYQDDPNQGDSSIARYTADGQLDPTFGQEVASQIHYAAGDAPVVMSADASFVDPDAVAAGNYAGATLHLQRHGTAEAGDVFGGHGELSLSGGLISLAGLTVGSYVQSTGMLDLSFNANATQARLDQVLQNLSYSNTQADAFSNAQIDWTFSDGDRSGALSVTVQEALSLEQHVPGTAAVAASAVDRTDIWLQDGSHLSARLQANGKNYFLVETADADGYLQPLAVNHNVLDNAVGGGSDTSDTSNMGYLLTSDTSAVKVRLATADELQSILADASLTKPDAWQQGTVWTASTDGTSDMHYAIDLATQTRQLLADSTSQYAVFQVF